MEIQPNTRHPSHFFAEERRLQKVVGPTEIGSLSPISMLAKQEKCSISLQLLSLLTLSSQFLSYQTKC